jgi:photosystem II stability/assembly factor-like uncharacterized protein
MRSFLLLVTITVSSLTFSQAVDHGFFNDMRWRMIGPHRGGRTVGACGVPQQPNTFYIGVNNGGVWKTTDFGRTWVPIFDEQPTGSIGDVVVAPSNPDIIYVGSGEGLQRPDLSVGDGMYKSADAGKTWTWLGLKDVQQVGGLAVDPKNENRIFVAALGHPYGPNMERGVYRSLDGGKTWEHVLFIDENTGAIQVAIDPNNPLIVFADLWAARQGPWENGAWNGKESGLYKSIDGGNNWRKISSGLPTTEQGLGRIGFCIAPSDSKRMYATVDAGREGGIFRSDDAGESWKRIQTDNRFWGRGGDFAEMKVDPKNPDIVYSANVVTWKSIDGGKTFTAFRGAPGGDDYHRIWINPDDPEIILIASDQGAIITVNGGETFSSWYNQPTAQFYHVITDNAFPYNVYGGQQESGSVGIASRGNDGEITFRDWHPVGVEEYGYVAPDPLNPDIIYGGKITRYDKRTGQTQNISPEFVRSGKYRFLRTAPVLFSPVDKKTLYFAGNVLFKTMNGGKDWTIISPDLSREKWDIPASVGIYTREEMKTMPRRGVIYSVAPSHKNLQTIWCGTDDGLLHITNNGGRTWKNITPPAITSWSKISLIDASHFDNTAAYVAVNRIRCDDMLPHIYKTKDGGTTWKEIIKGLPAEPVNVVREDPRVPGLLFAGTERAVYVSFDDGENWQSLRLNMPATSIRDLVIKDDDIVVGTHGRSFWILDNITPIRQVTAQRKKENILYKPQTAFRARWGMYTDTPYPQEEPAGQNPPDGAMIDYFLAEKAMNVEMRIEFEAADGRKKLARKFSSNDTLYKTGNLNIPDYWIRPQQLLSTESGHHRFVWDLKYEPLNIPPSYPIGAIYRNTAPDPTSPWVMPGTYRISLVIDGHTYSQYMEVKMDPRVKTSLPDLQLQHDLSFKAYSGRQTCMIILERMALLRQSIKNQLTTASPALVDTLKRKDKMLAGLETTPPGSTDMSFERLRNSFAAIFSALQDSDMPPTSGMVKTVNELRANLEALVPKWNELSRGE